MKKIKILIFALIIIIVILAITLLISMNLNSKNDSGIPDPEETSNEVYVEKTFQNLNIKTDYFIVKNCISSYYNAINGMYEDYTQNKEENIKYYQNSVYNMLGKDYIENFNISTNNLYNKYSKIGESKLILDKISYYDISESLTMYLVEGYQIEYTNNRNADVKLMLILDYGNRTYSVFPWEYVEKYKIDEYKQGDNINLNLSISQIEKNENNTFTYKNYTGEDMAKEYFEIYKFKALYLPEKAYEDLEEEYRNKRFGSLENYKNYIKEIYSEMYTLTIQSYIVNNNEDTTQYVCQDQYSNLYIFDAKTLLNYKVTLDTYTLEQEKFTTEYTKANDQKKVMMNIDKFFQMINAKDYTAAYNVLADSFKNNYFKTEAAFKQYMKQRVYSYNDVTYQVFSDEVSGVYQYRLLLTDRTNKNNTTEFNIVMKLNGGTDFEMSFEV